MFNSKTPRWLAAIISTAAFINCADAATIQITEWMYNGSGANDIGEFVELTNVGATAVNFAGWSFDDNSRTPGSQSLSGFGSVAPGESVIFTDLDAGTFRSNWNLSSSVKVVGGNTNNIGRSDEINIYDNVNALIDRLTYNDQATSGNPAKGPRTNSTSANPGSAAALGVNNASLWISSVVGDAEGSYLSLRGEIGNPGITSYAAPTVPLPAAAWLMLSGLGLLGSRLRSRKAS